MDSQSADIREKVRQQFDTGPYPRVPLERSPKNDVGLLFIHNMITPYYLRNRKTIDTNEKVILDAGCGTGFKSLVLAEANPGAKIVGIDLSEESLKLARQRLQYYNFTNAEFYQLAIEDLPSLGMQFDYINCDDVLYVLPNPVDGLQAMKSVLKPQGIIRANLHSSLQRAKLYRAQEVFKMMAFMNENPREMEIELTREIMKALKDDVFLKQAAWEPEYATNDEMVLMNYLFQGDKGYTTSEMFAALKAADLEFISMLNWRQWELKSLFKEPDNLPEFWNNILPSISIEMKLQLFELLHPIHRLLDFWCGHPNASQPSMPVDEWTFSNWQGVKVHLHPQLKTPKVKEVLIDSITNHEPFEILINATATVPIELDSSIAAFLLPLCDGEQPLISLMKRWLQIRGVDPVTLEPVSEKTALEKVKSFLIILETLLYVLLEPSI